MVLETQGIKPITDIIPHNGAIRQAIISPKLKPIFENNNSNTTKAHQNPLLTRIQAQAQYLYDMGLNIFPQPFGKKAGLPWKRLQYTRLNRDHAQYGLLALCQEKTNLAVMCGKTSNNLFVIDCESKDTLQFNIHQMRQQNIPIWAAETARGGHIYLFSSRGEIANIDTGTIPNTEIKGCRRYVLAPPSVHPTGAIYTWFLQEGPTPPTVDPAAITWLEDKTGNPVILQLDKPEQKTTTAKKRHTPHSALSRTTEDYLRSGHTIPPGSRNNRLFSAACDMVGNSYTEHEVHSQLAPIASNSGLPADEIHSTINSAFSRKRLPAKPDSQPQHQNWHYAEIYAEHHTWEGRTASSDKAVFLALVERARLDSNENGTFRASIREIATLAHIGTATTQKALKRLLKGTTPLIVKLSKDKMSGATLWQFHRYVIQSAKQMKTDTLPPSPPWKDNSVSVFSFGDALERGALGQNGIVVYQVLLAAEESLLPGGLAQRTKLKVHQVGYVLRKLRSFGLVKREASGWCAVQLEVAELTERVAVQAGTLGKGEARRQRFAEERELYAGRILWEAMSRLAWRSKDCHHIKHDQVTGSGEGGLLESTHEDERYVGVKFWVCPNCGQQHFSESPPDMCDVCEDFTTWRELPAENYMEVKNHLDDPLLALGVELGGRICEDHQDEKESD